MPLSFSEEGEQLADQSPCAELRARLKMCLLDSDCCKKVIIDDNFFYNRKLVSFEFYYFYRKEFCLVTV